jgi:hypothetical protein
MLGGHSEPYQIGKSGRPRERPITGVMRNLTACTASTTISGVYAALCPTNVVPAAAQSNYMLQSLLPAPLAGPYALAVLACRQRRGASIGP